MLRHDYPGQACSLAASLEVVGERWSLLIIRDVMNGNRRFSGIQASLGVAPTRKARPATNTSSPRRASIYGPP